MNKETLELLEILIPRIVAATLGAIRREERRAEIKTELSTAAAASEKKLNSLQIAAALNCGEWLVYGVKKANRIFAAQGRERLIFTGRYSSPASVSKWIEDHPDFVANRTLAPSRNGGGK